MHFRKNNTSCFHVENCIVWCHGLHLYVYFGLFVFYLLIANCSFWQCPRTFSFVVVIHLKNVSHFSLMFYFWTYCFFLVGFVGPVFWLWRRNWAVVCLWARLVPGAKHAGAGVPGRHQCQEGAKRACGVLAREKGLRATRQDALLTSDNSLTKKRHWTSLNFLNFTESAK